MKYQVYSDDSEVIGHSILSTVKCLNADAAQPHLERVGLGTIEPDQWYPLQSWLDVFNGLAEEGDTASTFVSIGLMIVETAVLPPEFDDMPFSEIVEMIDQAYKMNNRGTDIGAYMGEKISDQHVKVTITAPYPDDYNYGILYGFARRYLVGENFTVFYDKDLPKREDGGKATVIHVSWA